MSKRTDSTPTPATTSTAIQPKDDQPGEIVKISGRQLSAIKPSVDLKDLPGKLMRAAPAEQDRLLRGVHERFWHNSPKDMLRLLQAALLPKDIVLKGVQIA